MIVADASAAVLALLNAGDARGRLSTEPSIAPHLIDAEVAHALRVQVLRGAASAADARAALQTWSRLAVRRYPMTGLLDRMWDLRANLTAYDAAYVALAEAAGAALVTADARLAQAPGPRCAVTVVRT